MKKKRLIPVLLLKNGFLVQSKSFSRYQNLGNPVTAVKRLSEWAADELIYLDISRDVNYDMRRDDLGHKNRKSFLEIIEDVSLNTNMPITLGGRISSIDDITVCLSAGADKVALNTKAIDDPGFIEKAAQRFGSQCIVVSVDVKAVDDKYFVAYQAGRSLTLHDPIEWAMRMESSGAGEILLNSIDRDGAKIGYDLDLINRVVEKVNVPVIAVNSIPVEMAGASNDRWSTTT